jgi:hypothetical protein
MPTKITLRTVQAKSSVGAFIVQFILICAFAYLIYWLDQFLTDLKGKE